MDACNISSLGALCILAISAAGIYTFFWLAFNTGNHDNGPDYGHGFWLMLAIAPFLIAIWVVSIQSWVYNHEACETAMAELHFTQVQCEQKEQMRANNEIDDLQWLRAFRLREQSKEAKSKCVKSK